MIVLTFHDNGTIPTWFPTFDELPVSRRNVLHMSICFTGDLQYLDDLEELFACLIIADLYEDPAWTSQIHETYIKNVTIMVLFILQGLTVIFV